MSSKKYSKRSFNEGDVGKAEVKRGDVELALDELENWISQLNVEVEELVSNLVQVLREDSTDERPEEIPPRGSSVPLASRIFKSVDIIDSRVLTIRGLRRRISI